MRELLTKDEMEASFRLETIEDKSTEQLKNLRMKKEQRKAAAFIKIQNLKTNRKAFCA